MGLAFMLKKNQEDDGKRIVGLTSPGNLEFVKNTGYYDEVIAYNDFITFGGESGARDKGKLRIEGKEYVVQDGDVMHFRFNV